MGLRRSGESETVGTPAAEATQALKVQLRRIAVAKYTASLNQSLPYLNEQATHTTPTIASKRQYSGRGRARAASQ